MSSDTESTTSKSSASTESTTASKKDPFRIIKEYDPEDEDEKEYQDGPHYSKLIADGPCDQQFWLSYYPELTEGGSEVDDRGEFAPNGCTGCEQSKKVTLEYIDGAFFSFHVCLDCILQGVQELKDHVDNEKRQSQEKVETK